MPLGSRIGSISGLTEARADELFLTQVEGDARYLKLDTSNDPLTNSLTINKIDSTTDPTLYLTGTWDTYLVGSPAYMFRQDFTINSSVLNTNSQYGNYQAITLKSTSSQIGFLNTAYYSTTTEAGAGDVPFGIQGVTNDLQISNTLSNGVLGMFSSNWIKSTGEVSLLRGYFVSNFVQGSATTAIGVDISNFITGSATTSIGLRIQSMTGGTTMKAIQTRIGIIDFGDQVGITGSGDKVQFFIKANSVQNTDLMQWQNSSGTKIGNINSSGQLNIGQPTESGALSIKPDYFSNSTNGVYVRDAAGASYTGNYFQANNNGTDVFYVTRSLLYSLVDVQFGAKMIVSKSVYTGTDTTDNVYAHICDSASAFTLTVSDGTDDGESQLFMNRGTGTVTLSGKINTTTATTTLNSGESVMMIWDVTDDEWQ